MKQFYSPKTSAKVTFRITARPPHSLTMDSSVDFCRIARPRSFFAHACLGAYIKPPHGGGKEDNANKNTQNSDPAATTNTNKHTHCTELENVHLVSTVRWMIFFEKARIAPNTKQTCQKSLFRQPAGATHTDH